MIKFYLWHFYIRYFKQIAKSVRANGASASGIEENADDFLGCLNIPLSVSSNKQKIKAYNILDFFYLLDPFKNFKFM